LVGITGKLIPHPGIKPVAGKHTVYNFTVEDLHTYIAGDYRVHNESLSLYQPVTTGGLIGASIGSQIGAYFANDKFASQLVAQSLGKTVGSWTGDAIVYEFDLSDDPAFRNRSQESLSLGAIYRRLPGSVISTGIGLGSSKLANSLIKAFKIEDPLTQIAVSSLVVGSVSYYVTAEVAKSYPITAVKLFGAPSLKEGNIIIGVDSSKLSLTNSLANVAQSAFGSFAGSYLYSKLFKWNVLSEDVSVTGAKIGATIGAFAGSFIPIPVVGTAIGTLIGSVFGGLFGDKDYPRAFTSVIISNNQFILTPVAVDDKGNYDVAYNMGVAARDTLTTIAASIGGKPLSIREFRYGHFKKSYVYRPGDLGLSAYNYPWQYSSPQEAITNGIFQQVKSLQMEGGDIYVKRYLINLPGDVNTLDKLSAGFQVAREWGVYKDNPYLYEKTIQELDDNAISIADQQILELQKTPSQAPTLTNKDNKYVDFGLTTLPSKVTVSISGNNFIVNGKTVTPDQVIRFADGNRFKPVVRNGVVTLEAEQVANWLQIKPKAQALNLDTPQASDNYVGANASKIAQSNSVGTLSLLSRNLPISNYAASSQYYNLSPDKAFDGDYTGQTGYWNSGYYATKWIEVDLGQKYSLDSIKLLTAQGDQVGNTVHQIIVSSQPIGWSADGASFVKTFNGYTYNAQWLQDNFSNSTTARYIQVRTVASPSWVAWLEVEVYGKSITSGGIGDDVLIANVSGQILDGDKGDDVYRYNRGQGNITIIDASGLDTIEFDASVKEKSDLLTQIQGNDLIIAIKDPKQPLATISSLSDKIVIRDFPTNKIEQIRLGNNKEILIENSGSLVDKLNTPYRYNLGDGNKNIYFIGQGTTLDGGVDTLEFGQNITLNSLKLKLDNNNLIVTVKDTNTITIQDWLKPQSQIETFRLADVTE